MVDQVINNKSLRIISFAIIMFITHSNSNIYAAAVISNDNVETNVPDLISAARNGDNAKIRKLIIEGANLNITDKDGNTALIVAVQYGQLDIVRALINANANINAFNNFKMTALGFAAICRYNEIVKMLLDAGAIGNLTEINKVSEENAQYEINEIEASREIVRITNGNYEQLKTVMETEWVVRDAAIAQWKEYLAKMISQATNGFLSKDISKISADYVVDSYDNMLELKKIKEIRKDLISELLDANEEVEGNKLKRKADNTGNDSVEKKAKLSKSAIIILIVQLKEKREMLNKEIAEVKKDINNVAIIESKEEEIEKINLQIKSLEKDLIR